MYNRKRIRLKTRITNYQFLAIAIHGNGKYTNATASGEVVLMTILGGVGTLLGPVIGAGLIKYLENIFSSFNEQILNGVFGFLPDAMQHPVVKFVGLFVGEGWELTLGVLFLVLIIFVPGGLMQGLQSLQRRIMPAQAAPAADATGGAH